MPVMRIKELREQRGLTQAELAVQMGVIRSAVANWESEVVLPKTRDLPRLSRVLNCSINDLYAPDADPGDLCEEE